MRNVPLSSYNSHMAKKKNPDAQRLGRRGGIARKLKRTAEELSEWGRKAGKASAEKKRKKKDADNERNSAESSG